MRYRSFVLGRGQGPPPLQPASSSNAPLVLIQDDRCLFISFATCNGTEEKFTFLPQPMTNLLGRAAAPCTGESATRYAAAGGGWHPSPSVQVGGWWEGSEAKVSEIGEEERGRERGQRHHAHAAAVASPPEIWFESRPPSLARSRRLTLTCGQRRRGVGRRDHCPVGCCCRMIFYQNAES